MVVVKLVNCCMGPTGRPGCPRLPSVPLGPGAPVGPGGPGPPCQGTKGAVTSSSLTHLLHKDQLTHLYSRKSSSSSHSHLPLGAGGTNLAILTSITWRTLYTNSAVRTHIPHPSPLHCTLISHTLTTHPSPFTAHSSPTPSLGHGDNSLFFL